MTPDNSNISSLFGDIPQDTPPAVPATVPVAPEVSTSGVSGTVSDGIFSAIQSVSSEEAVVVTPPVITEATPPVVPSAPEIPLSETSGIIVPKNIEALSQTIVSPVVAKIPEVTHDDDEKFKWYTEQDFIYQSMMRIVDTDRIRLRLAIRYTIVMFAIFLVVVWVVNNRVIMFGFSEFQWLARIRDGLFGLLAGLFSLTLWFGSEVWFRKTFLIVFFRLLAMCFFAAVLSALYFPLW